MDSEVRAKSFKHDGRGKGCRGEGCSNCQRCGSVCGILVRIRKQRH